MLIVAAFAVAMFAILTRNVFHHPPTYDELLHVLAARGLVETGEPTIADGTYDRAEFYTRAVALATGFVGDELVAARAPAWLAALILVALVGAWTARRAGLFAGFAAGGLLAINSWTIDLAVFARFYTLHALAIFVAFVCVYETIAIGRRALVATAYAAVAAVALALAWHLQITTVIAIGALGLGILAGLAADRRDIAFRMIARYPAQFAVACIAVLVGAVLVIHQFDLLQTFRETPLWSAGAADRLNYYNGALAKDIPLFWPLVPFAVLGACLVHPRMAWTLAVITATALLVHSLAAPKSTRYVYYCLPFVCILLGCGLSMSFSFLTESFTRRWPMLGRMAPVLVLAAFGVSFAASQEGYRTARLLLGLDPYSKVLAYGDETSWSSARAVLSPLAAAADAIVTSNAMKAIYYLGRYDYELNASTVPETDTGTEFGIDARTGGRAISAPQSLVRLLSTQKRVLIIAETEKVGLEHGVPASTAAVAREQCGAIGVPEAARITVWWCPREER